MNGDAIYLVALQRVAEQLARAERSRMIAAVCAECHCVARWREVVGHGLIALGRWVEDARPAAPGTVSGLHWEGGR